MPLKRLAGLAVGLGLVLVVLCWPRQAQALNLCLLNCSCGVSTSAVTFSTYNALSASAATAVGGVQVSCQLLSGSIAQLVAFNVGLTSGGSNSIAARTMARVGGGTALAYNLYSDPGMTLVWGDGTGGSLQQSGAITVLLVGSPVSSSFSIYGKIPPNQQVAGGNYTDTITVTMSF
jgi:spore coat protein U-like protein